MHTALSAFRHDGACLHRNGRCCSEFRWQTGNFGCSPAVEWKHATSTRTKCICRLGDQRMHLPARRPARSHPPAGRWRFRGQNWRISGKWKQIQAMALWASNVLNRSGDSESLCGPHDPAQNGPVRRGGSLHTDSIARSHRKMQVAPGRAHFSH